MKILVVCEESQAVTIELRKLEHEVYSCDIEPCSDGHPEWRLRVDALELLKMHWGMVVAFPPCTHLRNAGQHWFTRELKDIKLRDEAIDSFISFVDASCDRVAIENPIGIMSIRYRKPNQIIQLWRFGHPHSKSTCLWLKGLPRLRPTDILQKPMGGWENQSFTEDGKYDGFVNRDGNGKILAWNNPITVKIRSKAFPGIARAMAKRWAGINQKN